MKKLTILFCFIAGILRFGQTPCGAWNYEGHRFVNQLALASLPADFPAFVKTAEARERIAFLGGEPDRWRNTADLSHFNAPDHFIDLDELARYGIDVQKLTPFRYDFVAQLALARAAHPEKFAPIDPAQDRDHTKELIGFLPWAIMENYDKLKSSFSYLKTFEKSGGTPEEIANAQRDIIYIMGVMGHYVGDAAQPLHDSIHYNGWVGENPNQYPTRKTIHSDVDGYFQNLDAAGYRELAGRVHPARLPGEELGVSTGDVFSQIVTYLTEQQKQVVLLYELDKAGKLIGGDEKGREGKQFLSKQLVTGGQMLGDLWFAAWQSAPEDTFLAGQLSRRALAGGSGAGKN